jgi:Fusaric acid resistance protein-like
MSPERLRRVRVSLGLAVQASIAAGLSWYVAHDLLGHVQPFFAPIAAVVVLAISVGQRLRRALELVVGNAIGILLGELLILQIGRGAWQVSLVVLLAIIVAVFAGGTAPLVSQAASSAILVATLLPFGQNYFLSRFVDAVVGGVIGVGVMALLLPLNPLTVVRRAVTPVLDTLASELQETAAALEARDPARAMAVSDQPRDTEATLRAYREAITAGQEISTVAPLRWPFRGALGQYLYSYPHVARALRDAHVLARRVHTMIADGEPAPASLVAAIRCLAEAVTWLRRELASGTEPRATRDPALRAVRCGADAYRAGVGFSGSVVVAQIRSTATDLVAASGLETEEARRQVRKAAAQPS